MQPSKSPQTVNRSLQSSTTKLGESGSHKSFSPLVSPTLDRVDESLRRIREAAEVLGVKK